MNEKTGGKRGPRAGVLAVVAAVGVLATACGGGSAPTFDSSVSGGSPSFGQELALARCIRGHGVPNFPDPNPSGGFTLNGTITGQMLAAYGHCRHLVPGSPSLTQVQQEAQQEQQKLRQLLPVLLKFSRCMRSHGQPDYPDPTLNNQGIAGNLKGAGIDPQSPLFLAAVRVCQHLAPGLHLEVHRETHAS
jgi:hypothetical protein